MRDSPSGEEVVEGRNGQGTRLDHEELTGSFRLEK
jgi:hypothetical protein